MNKHIRFPIRYFVITFIWSWSLWALLALFSNKTIMISNDLYKILYFPLYILGAFGPFIGATLSIKRQERRGSVTVFLRKFLDFRIGWKGFGIPILILGISTYVAWGLPELFGKERLPMLLPSIWIFFPCLLFMILLGGGQEEFGWRGYVLPILEKRYGVWYANIILGIIWACWHLPLWFILETNQVYMNFFGFVLLAIGYSYLLSWICKISNNKPFVGIYAHGLANAIISIMPTIDVNQQLSQNQPRYWIWVVSTFLIGVVITFFRKNNYDKI